MQTPDLIRLGTRESPLALAQTNSVAQQLHQCWPALRIEVKTFKTQGDLILDKALSKVGDKGLFVKELETALLENEIDLAIHSMKDMPGDLPDGLTIVSVQAREDARDALLSKNHQKFSELPAGAIIGTSSLRREAQLRRLRPDLKYENIRGNLQTRYRKLVEGPYSAIILAAAGLHRLNWHSRITQYFDATYESVPAVAQGILAAEFSLAQTWVPALLAPMQSLPVEIARRAERRAMQVLQVGCHAPFGAYCRPTATGFSLKGILILPDGSSPVIAEQEFDGHNPEAAGAALAHDILNNGGQAILEALATR